jgi:protocatechuate 3,4-dioxygenase beta subunit
VSFAGQVLAPDGKPAVAAKVWLTLEDWSPGGSGRSVVATAETGAPGRFQFAPAKPVVWGDANYVVCAYADGLAFAWTDRMHLSDPTLLLTLEPEVVLHGRVVDSQAKPVAGAKPRVSFLVRYPGFDPLAIGDRGAVLAPPDALSEMMTTATDDRGEFEVRRLPAGIDPHIEVRHGDYAAVSPYLDWATVSTGKPIELVLEPGARIRGRVFRAADGAALSGVKVAAYGGGMATTGKQGEYELSGLGSGVYQVYLKELPANLTAKAVGGVVVAPGATVTGIDLLAVPGVEVTGTVTEQGTGTPVPNVGICCNTAQQPQVGIAWPLVFTGADGRYLIRAPEGPAQVRPLRLPEGWRALTDMAGFRRFTVSSDEPPAPCDFQIVRARAVAGRVVGADGRPAAYARVLAAPDPVASGGLAFISSTVADGDGRFRFDSLRPGTKTGFRGYLGEDLTMADVILDPQGGGEASLALVAGARPTLMGRVVGDDGRPVPYAIVRADFMRTAAGRPGAGPAATAAPSYWRSLIAYAIADKEGRFALRSLWPGADQSLRVRAGGYGEKELPLEPLKPGEQRDVGDVRLPVADLIVTGQVVDDQGKPLPGVPLDVQRREGIFSRRRGTVTDRQGRFRVEALPREELTLAVDQFTYDAAPAQVGPGHTECVIKAMRREDQVLFRHKVTPPLHGELPNLTVDVRGLYRVRAHVRSGETRDFLAVDIETRTGDRPGIYPQVFLYDDRGGRLDWAPASVYVDNRPMRAFDLPRAGAAALGKIVVGFSAPWEGNPTESAPLPPRVPVPYADRALVLWAIELTDQWLGPADAKPAAPPYLTARVYTVLPAELRYRPVAATAIGGRGLVPVATLALPLGGQPTELPPNLAKWQDQLADEGQKASEALKAWGADVADDSVVGCYWFQSTGGHGKIALPESLTVTLVPYSHDARGNVAFENVPLPQELTAGWQPPK